MEQIEGDWLPRPRSIRQIDVIDTSPRMPTESRKHRLDSEVVGRGVGKHARTTEDQDVSCASVIEHQDQNAEDVIIEFSAAPLVENNPAAILPTSSSYACAIQCLMQEEAGGGLSAFGKRLGTSDSQSDDMNYSQSSKPATERLWFTDSQERIIEKSLI